MDEAAAAAAALLCSCDMEEAEWSTRRRFGSAGLEAEGSDDADDSDCSRSDTAARPEQQPTNESVTSASTHLGPAAGLRSDPIRSDLLRCDTLPCLPLLSHMIGCGCVRQRSLLMRPLASTCVAHMMGRE